MAEMDVTVDEEVEPAENMAPPDSLPSFPSNAEIELASSVEAVGLDPPAAASPVRVEEFAPFSDLNFSEDGGSSYDPGSRLLSGATSLKSTDCSGQHSGYTSTSRMSTHETEIDEGEVLLLEADEIDDDEDIPVSYQNALMLNEGYQSTLADFLALMQHTLEGNLARQQEIEQELNILQSGPKQASKDLSYQNSSKKSLGVFSFPYFKDIRNFSHPPNPDTIRKKENQELDVYLTTPREWSAGEKKKLAAAVKEAALRERLRESMDEANRLVRNAKQIGVTDEEKKKAMTELAEVKKQIAIIKATPEEELFHNRKEDFDWLRISAQAFNQAISAKSCELMWKNLLHPSLNQKSFTVDEDHMLQGLVKEAGKKNWDEIAEELGTRRTGFICCMRYQQKSIGGFDKRKWTDDEDVRLKQLVEKFKVNSFIPWSKVSYFMNKRTKEQCYQRYMYSLRDTLRKGTFSEEEDFMIMVGVKLFGEKWTKIADFLAHRTAVQLHSRYNTFLRADFNSWDAEEDKRLLRLAGTHGAKDWVRIAKEFKNKTRTQCRNRFYIILKWYQKDPASFNLNKLKISSLQQRRQTDLRERLERTLSEFLNKQKSSREEETKYGFRKTDLQGYHQTPDGITIPNQDLYNFMNSLKAQLPIESPTPAYTSKKAFSISATRLGIYEHKVKVVKTLPSGKTVTFNKSRIGRPSMDPNTKVSKVNRELCQFFRPSWISKQTRGRSKSDYKKEELKQLSKTANDLTQVLNCSKTLNFSKISQEDLDLMEVKEYQLFESFRDNKAEFDTIHNNVKETLTPIRPVKTYCRKRKQPPETSSPSIDKPSSIELVPPCCSTMIGFRGLLLHQRRLRYTADADEGHRLHKYRPDTNDVLTAGIFHPEIFEAAGKNIKEDGSAREENTDEPTPGTSSGNHLVQTADKELIREADERLFQRFKALFFWPAVLSGIKPSCSANKNLFSATSEETKLAAIKPFDATGIIQEYQKRTPTKRLRVVKQKKVKEERPLVEDAYSPAIDMLVDPVAASDAEEPPASPPTMIAPPPQKKRILAAAARAGMVDHWQDQEVIHVFSSTAAASNLKRTRKRCKY